MNAQNEAYSHVVVYDHHNKYKIGSLLSSTTAHMLAAKGVVSMPLDVELLRHNGAAGYALKHFGTGWVLDAVSPKMICPLLLQVASGESKLVWRAGLVKTPKSKMNGFIRLASDSGQLNVSGVGLGPSQPVTLEELDDQDYVVIGGESSIVMTGDYYVGLGLYAKGDGVSVEWFAVSQAPR